MFKKRKIIASVRKEEEKNDSINEGEEELSIIPGSRKKQQKVYNLQRREEEPNQVKKSNVEDEDSKLFSELKFAQLPEKSEKMIFEGNIHHSLGSIGKTIEFDLGIQSRLKSVQEYEIMKKREKGKNKTQQKNKSTESISYFVQKYHKKPF